MLADAIRYALEQGRGGGGRGPGNVDQGMVGVQAPASIPGVVAAGGTDRAGGQWTGSATGPELVLAAPGERIIAPAPPTVSPNGYVVNDGTSLSTAIISGVAALVRSRYPDLDAANVVNRLIRTARDEGPSGRDPRFGFGVGRPARGADPFGAPGLRQPAARGRAAGADRQQQPGQS